MAETKTNIPVEIKMGNAGTNDANLPAFKEGSIIFTKDTKKIYIDPVGETERIAVGGGDNSNISNDTATASLKQLQDSSYTGIKIKTKNSNAYNLDNTLTDNETIGSLGNFSSSFGGNTQAKGKRSFATGTGTIAKGGYSFASGSDSVALGSASHVEGYRNTTGPSADSAHAEGGENIVTSNRGHAEGYMNTVFGENSHAEGGKNTVSGENSHVEGLSNTASGKYSHAEGQETYAMGNQSHTEGAKTKALGSASHAEGDTNETYSYAAHIEGSGNKILTTINSSDTPGTGSGGSPFDPNFKIDEHRGDNSHVEGAQNLMYGYTAHAEGTKNIVKGHYAHAEGINNTITIDAEASHVEGNSNNVTSKYSHTEGYNNTNNGLHAHVEGYNNTTKSQSTHIEGENNTIENSTWAHVEGCNNSISNGASAAHVEGSNNDARGVSAHAEGASTKAWGAQSHSGGYDTVASGDYSFVHGISSKAMGEASVTFGRNNNAYTDQFVIGKYAKTYDDPNDTEIPYEYFAVGNGDSNTRKNAFTVYRDGHAEVQTQGTTDNSVAIKKYVDDNSGAGKKFGTSEIFNDYENNITYEYKGVKVTNITDATNSSTFTLESVAGLAAGGTFNIAYKSDNNSGINLYSTQFTIASVDTTNKTITTTTKYSGPPTSIYLLYVVNSTATDATPLYAVCAHAEGQKTKAIGICDHAEGKSTQATGGCSHAEGLSTTASGSCSHAQNFYTRAGYADQTAMGTNNINKSDTLLEVGNGSIQTASNAFEVYRDGHAEVQKMGTTDNSVAIKKYVDDTIGNITTTEAEEHAQIDSTEILTAQTGTWVTDGWTGNATTGFTHTSGNTSVLKYPITGSDYTTEGTLYDITFSCSVAPTVDNIMVRIGNSNLFNLYGQEEPLNIGVKSKGSTDGTIYLEFIPSSTFTGTISNIKVHKITGTYVGKYKITDSNDSISFEVRADTVNKYNAFIGVDSGSYNTTGNGNAGFGYKALANNTSGFWNTGIGFEALQFVNAGSRNIGIGAFAGRHIETGQRNIAIGTHSLRENRTGNFNIAIGADSQLSSTSGEYNIGVGTGTLYYNNGSENIAIGRQAIASTGTSGQNNIAIGAFSLNSVQGDNNIAIGRNAGYGITTGTSNIIIGAGSGRNGNKNTVIGTNSGGQLTENSLENTVIGYYSGTKLTNNKHCILIGNRIEGETTGDYQLNIGNLIKGSTQSSNKYVNIDGSLSAKSMSVDNVGTNDTDVVNKKYVDDIKTELLNAITHPYTYDETTKELVLIL